MIDQETLSELAGRLMRCPAAPYHEAAVRAEAELICAQHGLPFERDNYGNLLVRLETGSTARPLVLAAHLDHPGFKILRRLSSQRWLARFLGGVPECYFRPGVPLRLLPGGAPAALGKRVGREQHYEIHGRLAPRFEKARLARSAPAVGSARRSNSPEAAQFAVWELEDFAVRGNRVRGRACDDLIGVASILATLIELKDRRAHVNVIGVISRAEEVGFHGALAVAGAKRLPANSLVISLETSRELPPIKMGQGVILRVGDRTSIFDSAATRFLSEVAQGLAGGKPPLQWQRALMSGGTCEATAYQELGFQTAAVCVALGNYHNCSTNGAIAPEFINLSDAWAMVRLLVEAARQMPAYAALVSKLPRRMRSKLKEARHALREG